MIASINGQLQHVGLESVVVEVGGVGLHVHLTPTTAGTLRTGGEVHLATSLVVREDAWTLYGFTDIAEKELFEGVQKVTGIGPRIALSMLSVLSPDQVRAALGTSDVATLCKVPGVGKKSAERLILELKDKLGMPATSAPDTAGQPYGAWRDQVHEALIGLGWSARQADEAVTAVEDRAASGAKVPELLRAALQELGR